MKEQIEKLDLHSHDIAEDKRQELLRLFPEIRTEGGKLDFERLKLALGESVDVGKERYGMTWPGKADCFKSIQMPSLGTLRPCPEESVNFETTENLIIEGDNLEVLKLLQKSYLGKVKMIYIDPPYNTGNDFIYPDNYSESLQTYLEYTVQVDAEGKKFSTNAETDGRFHSKWLNMMYPRLYLARNLMRDDGVIFVSCDDHEAPSVRFICNEIFGEENFVAQFVWNTEGHTDNQFDVKVNHEYVVLYAKNFEQAELGYVIDPNTRQESNLWKGFAENSITKNGPGNPPSEVDLPEGFPCSVVNLDLPAVNLPTEFFEACNAQKYISRELTDRFSVSYPIRLTRMQVGNSRLAQPCRVYSGWANVNKLRAFIANGCRAIDEDGDQLSFYLSDKGVIYYRRDRQKARNILSVLRNMGTTERMRSELEEMGIPFQYPKPKELLSYLVQIGVEDGIVLDFFAGSSTTAHAALQLNAEDGRSRNFILVQLPEPLDPAMRDEKPMADFCDFLGKPRTLAEITKERVRRVIKKLDNKDNGKLNMDGARQPDCGFRVFKLSVSNFKPWDAEAPHEVGSLEKQLDLHVDHIREGRTADDLLYELLLKSGYPLTAPVEVLQVAGKQVHSVAGGVFFVCLERELTLELIRAMADKKPERVVCLDEGFSGNDQLKANAVQIFKTKGVTSFKTV
ncbi:MAG: site-specific DNA-methyltransferase [Nitrospiraceae bacterium]